MSKTLVQSFYESFRRLDAEAMAESYHPDARFRDPVFTDLQGTRIGDMWRMLCARSTDLEVRLIEVSDDGAHAKWTATYSFSGTGRKVHNEITASFKFKDGKIIDHTDAFNLWRWAGMALGAKGTLFGWTPMVQGRIRGMANKSLASFVSKKSTQG